MSRTATPPTAHDGPRAAPGDRTDDPAALLAALDVALADALDEAAAQWLDTARRSVAAAPGALAALFPAVGRRCGRGPLALPPHGVPGGAPHGAAHDGRPGWTVAEAVRALLLAALPLTGEELMAQAAACYRYGDADERIGVLRALPLLDVGALGVPLVEDALRTNDTRLVTAAVGPYAAARLGQEAWRHAVLKCLFTGIPLTAVARVDERADPELARMLRDFADERRAAGRPVPPDIAPLVAPFDPAAGPSGLSGPSGLCVPETAPPAPARPARPGARSGTE